MKTKLTILAMLIGFSTQANPRKEIRRKCRNAVKMSRIKAEKKMIRKSKRIELRILKNKDKFNFSW